MIKLLIFVLLVVTQCTGLRDLCAHRKADNQCMCRRFSSDTLDDVFTVADCASIGLQDFPDESQLRNDLSILDLSFNEISRLESFASETLDTLTLSYNSIDFVNDDFFKGVPNLHKLDLSHNRIQSLDNRLLFANVPQLKLLDLSFNSLKVLPSQILAPLQNLNYFDISYNDVSLGAWITEAKDGLTANLGLNESVAYLKLNSLGIQAFHSSYFDNYTNLRHLSLADNDFESIPNVPYSVEYLDLSGCNIEVLQAKHLNYHSLKTFKLNRLKKLNSIHKYAFYNLQSLEDLEVNDCKNLREFNDLVFSVLSKSSAILPLKRLSLAKNGLKTLNYTYKYLLDHLEEVDLSDNPWNCNCDLLWLKEYEQDGKNSVRCSSPRSLRGRMLTEVADEDMPNCYPQKYGKRAHRILLPIMIVLIIILSALIAYLIFYSPSFYGNRSGLGPQSPYNPARIEED